MATLPSASTTVDDSAGGQGAGSGYCAVMGCVASNADGVPRVFPSAKALLAQHGYSPAVDKVAMFIEATRKPVLFYPLPTATAATAGSHDSSGVTGTSQITVAAGASGYVEELDAILTVTTGGTVGTNGIVATLSLDGGRTEKTIRLGTATSYTVPYVGAVISFGAGTLVAGDVYTFRTNAPMWDGDGLAAARAALQAQQKLTRSWVVIGDLPSSTFAGYVTTQANAYETSGQRFVYVRAQVADRRLARAAKVKKSMTGAPSLTFAEVGATGDTITRATGSWITDGFEVGDIITVAGSASNNVTGVIAALSGTVLTLDTTDLVAETTAAATVVGSPGLTFAEVGSTGDTVTRSSGSWVADGFAVGQTVAFTGTASNNVTGTIAALSATVLTFGTTDLAAEVIGMHNVTATQVQTMAAWVSAQDAAFTSVDDQKRVDLGLGRGRKVSPITGWKFRRPASWFASIREYQHDLHIATYRKADGPLDGVDLNDEDGQLVEFDERVDGGGLAGRFTCLRTWANGPEGAYVALSLTRAVEGTLLSRTHNLAVANLVCTTVQRETEMAVGQSLVLNDDGTGTDASLSIIEGRVNSALQRAVLQEGKEGPLASKAVWSASRTDLLNFVGAVLTGVTDLELNGTLEQIETSVRVR